MLKKDVLNKTEFKNVYYVHQDTIILYF